MAMVSKYAIKAAFYFVLFICCCQGETRGQEWRIGAEGGLTTSYNSYITPQPGPGIGMSLQRVTKGRLSFSAGVTFLKSKAKVFYTGTIGNINLSVKAGLTAKFIQIPLYASYRVASAGKFKIKTGFGIVPDLLLNTKAKTGFVTLNKTFNHPGVSLALQVPVIEYEVFKKLSIGIEHSVQYELTTLGFANGKLLRENVFLTAHYQLG